MNKAIIILALVFTSMTTMAKERRQYSVTGKSGSVNAWHYELIECKLAMRDAKEKANDLCYAKGYNYAIRLDFNNCRNRIFGGKKVKLKFYCQ